MIKSIKIETAANGYIATDASLEMGMCARAPYVFETFDALTNWLSQQLEKPKNQKPDSR